MIIIVERKEMDNNNNNGPQSELSDEANDVKRARKEVGAVERRRREKRLGNLYKIALLGIVEVIISISPERDSRKKQSSKVCMHSRPTRTGLPSVLSHLWYSHGSPMQRAKGRVGWGSERGG